MFLAFTSPSPLECLAPRMLSVLLNKWTKHFVHTMLIRIHSEACTLELKEILEYIFSNSLIFTRGNLNLQGFKEFAQSHKDAARGIGPDHLVHAIFYFYCTCKVVMPKDRVRTSRAKKKKKKCLLSFAFFYTQGYILSFEFNKCDCRAVPLLCNCAAALWNHLEVHFSDLIQLSWNFKNYSDPLKFFKTLRMMCIKRFKLNNYGHRLPLIPKIKLRSTQVMQLI